MKNIVLILLACAIFAGPVACISPWFTASFNDLKFTLYRYGYCVNGLQPVASSRLNETDFLVNQIKRFLDQGNYDNEQLANVSSLMDTICRSTNAEPSYPISMHVNISSFNSSSNPHAKSVRCHAIDEALDSMYHVFKKAALNRSEPLDFSSIQFYPNATDKSASYNLSDLINTSWITSEVVLEHVCSITNATKEYVLAKSSNSTAQPRREVTTSNPLYELISLLMDPLLGLQKRLSWETTNTLELIQTRVGSGLGSMGQTIVYGYNRTRDTLLWRPRGRTNSLVPTNVTDVRLTANLTTITTRLPRLNSTGKPTNNMDNVQTLANSVTAKPSSTLASVTSTTSMPGTSVTTNQPTTTTTHQTTSTTYQPTTSTSSNFNATTRVTGVNRTTST